MPGASFRRPGPVHLRNPATSVVTWPLPLLTGVFAAIAYDSVLGSAFFFFLTVFIYGLLYRVMSLNAAAPAAGACAAALTRTCAGVRAALVAAATGRVRPCCSRRRDCAY